MDYRIIDKEDLTKNMIRYLNLIKGWKYCNWTYTNFLHELPSKWEFSFSTSVKDKLLGFCFASNKIPGVYYIHLIFLSSESRGKKMGSQMIAYAKQIALKNDIHTIELRCPESNTESLEFYKRLNFKIVSVFQDEISGEEKDYYLRLIF